MKRRMQVLGCCVGWLGAAAGGASAQEPLVRVELAYAARSADKAAPAPNFSPAGTRVPLADVDAGMELPAGAVQPARAGVIKVGPGEASWLRVLASAEPAHPKDLCRVYIDYNRNGRFDDDGNPLTATPTAREKTGDMWSSFPPATLSIPYASGASAVENYQVNVWIVRQGDAVPDLLRYSVASWRAGKITVAGVEALVAAFDGNNDAVFDASDQWSVLEASAADAPRQVLSHLEARPAKRMMFVKGSEKESVLEFRSITPEGRSMTFALVDRPVTKADDRLADDSLREERARPRAAKPFEWLPEFEAARARSKASGKKLLLDFWTSWCGPCQTMHQWMWTDAEVVGLLSAGYVGARLDGDLEKTLVKKFNVSGYPTFIVLDPGGREVLRFGYKSSKEIVELLK